MKRLVYLSVLVLILLISCTPIPQTGIPPESQETPAIAQAVFPLSPGACWTYEGTVKWSEGGEVKEKAITWRMEVLDMFVRGDVTGYKMRGHPRELAWYMEGLEPGEYAILRVGANRFYYADVEAYSRLANEADDLGDLVRDEDVFLELPLQEGKRFCETEQILREDGMYCWVTGKGEPVQMTKVTGLNMAAPLLEYPVLKLTQPDRMIVGFTPGVGITHFTYVHHGTVAEVNLVLSELQFNNGK